MIVSVPCNKLKISHPWLPVMPLIISTLPAPPIAATITFIPLLFYTFCITLLFTLLLLATITFFYTFYIWQQSNTQNPTTKIFISCLQSENNEKNSRKKNKRKKFVLKKKASKQHYYGAINISKAKIENNVEDNLCFFIRQHHDFYYNGFILLTLNSEMTATY